MCVGSPVSGQLMLCHRAGDLNLLPDYVHRYVGKSRRAGISLAGVGHRGESIDPIVETDVFGIFQNLPSGCALGHVRIGIAFSGRSGFVAASRTNCDEELVGVMARYGFCPKSCGEVSQDGSARCGLFIYACARIGQNQA